MYLNREIAGIRTTPAEVIAIAAKHGSGQTGEPGGGVGGGLGGVGGGVGRGLDGAPRDRIVVCGYDGTHLAVVMPLAMNVPACERVDRLRRAASTLGRIGLTHCALICFGAPMFGAAHRLIDGLNHYGITVPLAVALTGGRCHSFLPDDWPVDGIPYPPDASATEKYGTGVGAGLGLAVGADTSADAAAAGTPRMADAIANAAALMAGAYRVAGIQALRDHRRASYRFLRRAVTRYTAGDPADRLTNDEIAVLALQLQDDRIRDEALALIHHHGPLTAHRKLWADVKNRAVPPYDARAYTLFAYTLWLDGDACAGFAVELALKADPGDTFTNLLDRSIKKGLPPHTLHIETPGQLAARDLYPLDEHDRLD